MKNPPRVKKTPPRGRGRPPLPEGQARTVLTAFKVSEREAEAIRRASASAQMEKSEWMRETVLQRLGME